MRRSQNGRKICGGKNVGEMAEQNPSLPLATWQQVLVERPPGTLFRLREGLVVKAATTYSGFAIRAKLPELEMHCQECRGLRVFKSEDGGATFCSNTDDRFIEYACKNCEKDSRTYAVKGAGYEEDGKPEIFLVKFGQWPEFRILVPSSLLKLLDKDTNKLFQQGRRGESLGMGMGAFIYYRRVVDNLKDKLFDRIIAVAESSNAKPAQIERLRAIKAEHSFKKAMTDFKEIIPPPLLIKGHNPLALLYAALSKGVHEMTDDECLIAASDIRTVLTSVATRASQLLRDETELNQAVGRLTRLP